MRLILPRFQMPFFGLLIAILLVGCGSEIQPPPSSGSVPVMNASQMESSISAALNVEEPVLRMKLLATALESLDSDNAQGAASVFREKRPTVTEFDILPFASRWAVFDPIAAIEFSRDGLKEGRPRAQGYKSIVFSWVASGGASDAAAYNEKLNAEGDLIAQSFQSNLIQALVVNRQFDVAMPLLEAMPQGTDRNALLLGLTFELAKKGVPYLIDWSQSVPVGAPNNLKAAIFSQSMSIVARSDPERAAAWYGEEGYQDFVRGDAMALIVTEWIKHDPIKALEWAITQPPSDDRDAAVRGAVYRWQMDDSETSEPWLRENLTDPAMEVAIYPFAQWLVYQNPVEALAWGLRVPDRSERYFVVQQSFIRWRREDQVAAMDWLEKTDLPKDLRREIDGLIQLEGVRDDEK